LRIVILLLLLFGQVIGFGLLEGTEFVSAGGPPSYFGTLFMDAVAASGPLLPITLALALISRTGGLDLSLAAVAAAAACLMARFQPGQEFWWTALPAALALCAGAGLINGGLVALQNRTPKSWAGPIGVTLVTMAAFRALALLIGRDDAATFALMPGYDRLGRFEWVMIHAAVLLGVLLLLTRFTPWGRRLGAFSRAGAETDRGAAHSPASVTFTYALAGALALSAAVIYAARGLSADPMGLAGVEVQAVAAALLGGAAFGRRGAGLIAALFGAMNVAVLAEGDRITAYQVEALPRFQGADILLITRALALVILIVWGLTARIAPRQAASRRPDVPPPRPRPRPRPPPPPSPSGRTLSHTPRPRLFNGKIFHPPRRGRRTTRSAQPTDMARDTSSHRPAGPLRIPPAVALFSPAGSIARPDCRHFSQPATAAWPARTKGRMDNLNGSCGSGKTGKTLPPPLASTRVISCLS